MRFWKQPKLISQPDAFFNIVRRNEVKGHFNAGLYNEENTVNQLLIGKRKTFPKIEFEIDQIKKSKQNKFHQRKKAITMIRTK